MSSFHFMLRTNTNSNITIFIVHTFELFASQSPNTTRTSTIAQLVVEPTTRRRHRRRPSLVACPAKWENTDHLFSNQLILSHTFANWESLEFIKVKCWRKLILFMPGPKAVAETVWWIADQDVIVRKWGVPRSCNSHLGLHLLTYVLLSSLVSPTSFWEKGKKSNQIWNGPLKCIQLINQPQTHTKFGSWVESGERKNNNNSLPAVVPHQLLVRWPCFHKMIWWQMSESSRGDSVNHVHWVRL